MKEHFTPLNIILGILVVINITTFCYAAYDKLVAVVNNSKGERRRIPEAKLLFLSFIGGALGMFLAMGIFRHKINKPIFYITVPFLLLVQLVLIFMLIWK